MSDVLAGILAKMPNGLRPVSQAELDADQFDPLAWRLERTRGVLARRIPAEFQDAVVDVPEAEEWLTRFVQDPGSARHLVLIGFPGTGKTYTAYGLVREAALAFERERGRAMSWQFRTHVQLAMAILPKDDQSHLTVIEKCKAADLLVIDDLASARIKDWGSEVLLDIVDTRWAAHRPMVVTSNADPGRLDKAVGDRIASRLLDSTRVAFLGDDRRGGDQ